ncbi:PREDICTED: ATP synthase subunit delta, mitochondrial-like [Myotis davidii]|uniref:ATP synthase subunit delta, mitochondrial-like n=1 Tax=Myotis davidii TaxID=225400 RepID=UPI0003EC32BC|nr:PREDICTED: ATP synthase subunit delta, mitochondrial-like [Myotis davidii]
MCSLQVPIPCAGSQGSCGATVLGLVVSSKPGCGGLTPSPPAVSSGSVTVNADSSVQLLAEEAVSLDMLDLGAAKANLEKAQSELSGASDEAMRAEIQIRIEANEALVKALE